MSQADLARLTGLSRELIANIETGRRMGLYVSEVFAIAEALGVDVCEMLGEAPMSLRIEVPVDE